MNSRLPPAHPVAPIPVSERIGVLDALRGLALLGVLIVHVNVLAANVLTASAESGLVINAGLDRWVERIVRVFLEEKAQTLFAALFGASFAIQFARLESRGHDAATVYTRRLLGLLVIGALHVFFLPTSDILLYFAIGGFVLLLVRRWDTWVLVLLGSLLALTTMPTADVLGAFGPSAPLPRRVGNGNFPAVYQYGSYLEIMKLHWSQLWFVARPLRGLLTFQLYVLGRLMLGVAVTRAGVPTNLARHRGALQWATAIGLVGGFVFTEFAHVERFEESVGWISQPEPWQAFTLYVRQAGVLLLATGYAALVALAWQVNVWRRLLAMFAPIGQMAVTNYLLQSVFLSIVFYGLGFGMLGRLGSAACLLAALGFFALQCVFSHLWMRSFQFGPVEWLWRGWTYRKLPPWRHTPGIAAEV